MHVKHKAGFAHAALAALTLAAAQPASAQINTIASFNGTNGAGPYADLTFDNSGNLYGTTQGGGAGGYGTVFEIQSGSNAIIDLDSFNNTNGANPYSGVIFDSQGNLYGTTIRGGADGDGTVFRLNNPNAALTPESSGLANLSGALLALGLGGLVTAVKKRAKKSRKTAA